MATIRLMWFYSGFDLLDEGLGQLVALGAVRAAVRLVDAGLLGVQLLFGEPRVQQLHQLQAAQLPQQLGLEHVFTGLKPGTGSLSGWSRKSCHGCKPLYAHTGQCNSRSRQRFS